MEPKCGRSGMGEDPSQQMHIRLSFDVAKAFLYAIHHQKPQQQSLSMGNSPWSVWNYQDAFRARKFSNTKALQRKLAQGKALCDLFLVWLIKMREHLLLDWPEVPRELLLWFGL